MNIHELAQEAAGEIKKYIFEQSLGKLPDMDDSTDEDEIAAIIEKHFAPLEAAMERVKALPALWDERLFIMRYTINLEAARQVTGCRDELNEAIAGPEVKDGPTPKVD